MNLSKLYADTAEVYAALAKDPATEYQVSDDGVDWCSSEDKWWQYLRLVKQPTAEELRVAANRQLRTEYDAALAAGKPFIVQYLDREDGAWYDCCGPFWFDVNTYRRKPEPKLVPFTFEDKLCGLVFTLNTDGEPCRSMATRQDRFGAYLAIGQVRYEDLLTGWTLDGKPAGKEQA